MKAQDHIKIAENIVEILENKFSVGPFKFGLDPILGLFPFVGDAIPAIMSLYLVWVAFMSKVTHATIIKMIVFILIDYIVGSIPILGDIVDFFFKAHTKNLELLKKEIAAKTK